MPIYDYRCVQCGREVEVMHGIHESGPQACAACGGVMRKALSTPAIHFRGSGWAKKDAAASAAKAKPAGAAEGSTTPEKGSDDAGKAASSGSGKATSSDTTTAGTATSTSGSKGD